MDPFFPHIQAVQRAERHQVSLGIDSQPGSPCDSVPNPVFDTEPGPMSENEDGALSNTEPGPMANNLPASPIMSASEPPYLPTEILSMIIACSLNQDVSMLGLFNRVSALFRDQAATFHHQVYIRESLAEDSELDKRNDCSIRIMKLYKAAGCGSGLSKRLKELFGKDSRWMQAWVLISHVAFGWYKIKDIYWKK